MKFVSTLPFWIKPPLRRFRKLFFYGNKKYCPICDTSSSRFLSFGSMCAHCSSLERHRFSWIYLSKKTAFFNGKKKTMLHVAPELCFEQKFKKQLGDGYITSDLANPNVMVQMDITDINYPDESFDIIYCSHVLEHVVDDKTAIKEFYRVLKDKGWAILLVPITSTKTVEDASIIDPAERLKHYGQEDHVRRYGPDYVERLRDAGFKVEITKVNDLVEHDEAIKMGLTAASGEIYFCTKY